jgi:putative N6-adenine-specific DNA methylase
MKDVMSLFVTCGQGLEELLASELVELGHKEVTLGYCGVYVKDTSQKTIYSINYRSRLASRVLLPLFRFRCRDQRDLYENCFDFDWGQFFTMDQTFAIDANVQHRLLRNSLFALQVLKDAICDRLREATGSRPSVDPKNPDIQLNLFIDNDEAVVSFDTSGQPLHKRNYRLDTGAAPLQETLAAALLRMARFDPAGAAIDPCCGSGTLLIEAALMATNTPPGYLRKSWGFFAHPEFDREAWQKAKDTADAMKKPLKPKSLWGIEIDRDVAQICRANIKNAGLSDAIEIICAPFQEHVPVASYNFLITNPPHGIRLGAEEELKPLYRGLGDFMKQKMSKPSRGFIFTTSKLLGKEVGLSAKRRHVISSSGMDARLLEFDIY